MNEIEKRARENGVPYYVMKDIMRGVKSMLEFCASEDDYDPRVPIVYERVVLGRPVSLRIESQVARFEADNPEEPS